MGNPDAYLGIKFHDNNFPNVVEAWITRPNTYVQEAVKNIELHFSKEYDGMKLVKYSSESFAVNYKNESQIPVQIWGLHRLPITSHV